MISRLHLRHLIFSFTKDLDVRKRADYEHLRMELEKSGAFSSDYERSCASWSYQSGTCDVLMRMYKSDLKVHD